MVQKKYAFGCCVCCTVLITSIVLIVVSIHSLGTTEVGLEYNGATLKINDDELFSSGRHFLGVGHKFFKYPSKLQTVTFSSSSDDQGAPILARTREGLEVSLSVSFNFKIQQNIAAISALYLDFGEMGEVQAIYNRIARNWIRSVAAEYTAFQFFFNRSIIQVDMEETLHVELTKAHASVEQLQLLDIDLPDAFEAARERQSAAFEEIRAAESRASVDRQEAEDSVAAAERALQVLLLEAESTAVEILNSANATAAALESRYRAEQESLKSLADRLGFSQAQLLAFVWNEALNEAQTSKAATINLNTPSGLDFA